MCQVCRSRVIRAHHNTHSEHTHTVTRGTTPRIHAILRADRLHSPIILPSENTANLPSLSNHPSVAVAVAETLHCD